jgi:hypothetical protein
MEAAVWALVGTIVGALASIGTTWLSTRTSYALQREKAREERLERANAFQRQTLLDLQDAIHDGLRLVHRAYMEDLALRQKGEIWGKGLISDEVSEGVRLSQRKLAILVQRVSEDTLRQEVKAFMERAWLVSFAGSREKAEAQLNKVTGESAAVLERVGAVLRSHY